MVDLVWDMPSRIERGQANPTTATLGTLTRALDVDVRLVPAA